MRAIIIALVAILPAAAAPAAHLSWANPEPRSSPTAPNRAATRCAYYTDVSDTNAAKNLVPNLRMIDTLAEPRAA